jgi:hypothetical protein
MAKYKYFAWALLLVFGCGGIVFLSTPRSQSQNRAQIRTNQTQKPAREKIVQAENIDTSNFPIAEFSARPANEKERAKRDTKGKKYNSKYAPPISESSDSIHVNTDWDVNLPAFPVEKSAAVVIGRVTKAAAHLSENKTNIYSEFEVQIDEVLKNDGSSIASGSSLIVERAGGRVKLPSGKLVVSIVEHQQLPEVGRQYLLFLTHESPLFGEPNKEDFFILTAYEFRDGRVFPLDKTLPGHPIAAITGVDESSFLNDLNSALVARPQSQ